MTVIGWMIWFCCTNRRTDVFLAIEILCNGEELRDAIRDLLSFERHPREVRIISPVVTNPQVWQENSLLQILTRLSRVDGIMIVLLTTRPYTRKSDAAAIKEIQKRKDMIEKLESIGVRVHFLRSLHAKLILAHSGRDKLLLVCSSNMTRGGLWKNTEAGIVVKNEATHLYDRLYEHITRLLKESLLREKSAAS